nr:RNA-directed DNA polymerase, eukaryota [Tanacetum cinerariifolium]
MIGGMAGFTKEECPQCVISQGEDFASHVLPSQSTCTKESCEEYCKSNEPPNTKLVCVKCEGNTCYCCSVKDLRTLKLDRKSANNGFGSHFVKKSRHVYDTDIITVDQGHYENLSTRTRQRVLAFGGPRQKVVTKKNTVSKSRLARSRITCPTQHQRFRRAWKGDLGIEEEVVTCKLYLGLAFTISTLERVTIGCCEVRGGGGGGGGVVGGVGVVCGEGVDSRVRGVDCRVVCGFVCMVDNIDRLVMNLCAISIGRFHLHENVARFHREHKTYAPSHPSNVIVRNLQDSGDDLKYPPGFEPSMINMEEVNKKEKWATSNEVNDHVNSTSNKLEEPVPKAKLTSNDSACLKRRLKKDHWAIEGDENTKFFHGILNGKNSRFAIRETLIDGEWIVDPLVVKNKGCVLDCGTNKSLSPDGFTFEFFRRYWNLFEHDIVAVVENFLLHVLFLEDVMLLSVL